MRAVRLHGAGDARLEEVPEPQVGPGQVKVRVERAAICGSDLALFSFFPEQVRSAHPLFGEDGPHVLGHELAGTVEAVGRGVDAVTVGALVAVRPNVWDGTCPACRRGETNLCEQFGFVGINGGGGGYSEHVVVAADAVHELPASAGVDAAVLVESLSVAWHAVKLAGTRPGGSALIVGAGPIGLSLLLCLKARGVKRVVVSEVSEARRALAARLGAQVVDPRTEDPVAAARQEDGGVDVSFDASGVGAATFLPALDALRSGGTSVVVAQFHHRVEVDPNVFLITEKRLVGSFAYTDEDFAEVVAMVGDGTLDPRTLVSSHIGLGDAVSGGLEHLLGAGRNSELKIVIDPQR